MLEGWSRYMAARSDIENALQSAMLALAKLGKTCEVSAEDIAKWFEADTLYPDITLDEVLKDPWLVVHEIVEIDAVKKAGLVLTKDVIITHLAEVDRAHYEAAMIELKIAAKNKDATHLMDRIPDIRNWSKDPHVLPEMRARYARLCSETEQALRTIENEE
jgi:hypothetical protein